MEERLKSKERKSFEVIVRLASTIGLLLAGLYICSLVDWRLFVAIFFCQWAHNLDKKHPK